LKDNEQPVLALLMFGVWALGYLAIARVTEGDVSYPIPTLAWEEKIPFLPVFVWIYLCIYPLFVLPFLFIRDKQFFRLFSFTYILVMCICYLCYLVIPVSFTRRPDLVVDSFSTFALSIVFRADNSWNCFPSMHVAMSWLAALTILEVHRVRGILATLLAVLIAASTVLIKQHYVLDVVAGMAITLGVYFAFYRRRVHDILFTNIQRMEETLENWITRKIEQKVAESMENLLRERIDELILPQVRDRMRAMATHRMPEGKAPAAAAQPPDGTQPPERISSQLSSSRGEEGPADPPLSREKP
jgi:membrane-associated phospholipid phosphatase